jgi:hypothetical protein
MSDFARGQARTAVGASPGLDQGRSLAAAQAKLPGNGFLRGQDARRWNLHHRLHTLAGVVCEPSSSNACRNVRLDTRWAAIDAPKMPTISAKT